MYDYVWMFSVACGQMRINIQDFDLFLNNKTSLKKCESWAFVL